MNLQEMLEDKKTGDGASISWLPEVQKSEPLETFSRERHPFLKREQGLKEQNFTCITVFSGYQKQRKTGLPDLKECPSSGVGKLVMVSEPRRDSQLQLP